MNVHRRMEAILLAGLMMSLTGCQLIRSGAARNGLFDYEGMPGREYLVGGGYRISYRARVEGDLFLAEDHSNRLLATITLEPGEKHDITYDVNNKEMIENLQSLGIDPKQATFKLYFVPR
jgi:hypothetical protein